ncbi:hypothetical protein Ate02nite_90000 [Paractinoplanes tereljensis]|uniref:Uncharacterized protein n=2 Tax=Paractinoplanes tereljensis TaxID=571912 RepID=A0A919TZH2_9ACTN|nr:hypothetical protein Ate02nite_90000 [Actinoplanes tereljensis]
MVTILILMVGVFSWAPAAAQAAPPGTRIWFHQGEDQYTPSNIWSFESTTGTGFRRGFIPSRTAWPVQSQYPFTYRTSGASVVLTWTASGSLGRVTPLNYSSASDVMLVNVDGRREYWYGCRSAGRPAYAQAAC